MPAPLQRAAILTSFPDDFEPRECSLLNRVGRHDGLGHLLEVVKAGAQVSGQAGKDGDEFLGRQRDTDDAGGGGNDLFQLAMEELGGGLTGGARRIETGLASGAVGVAGVDGGYAHLATSCT